MNKGWTTSHSTLDSNHDCLDQRRSQTIPMPRSHVPRTDSEVQLREDMAAAEWRDLCMFYRVVHGIRERQNASPEGVAIDASDITNEAIERIVSARQSTEPTVTPYDSSNEASPHSHRYREQAEGYLSQHPVLAPPSSEYNDGWSISGFEEADMYPSMVAVVEVDEDIEEDGVFSMEL